MIEYQEGNIFNLGFKAIAHGCNAQGIMGAGMAKQVRQIYPEVFEAYRQSCLKGLFNLGDMQCVRADDGTLLYNLCTQEFGGPNADLNAIRASLSTTRTHLKINDVDTLAIPLIGCGIGGLKWDIQVSPIVEEIFGQESLLTLVVVTLPEVQYL